MNLVVVGASGYMGSAIYQRLSDRNRVIGTYCFCPVAGMLRFDMLRDDPAELPVDWAGIDAVVLAAGMARIEECARRRVRSQETNVTAVAKFCEFAASHKLHVTHLSTDHVYDGTPRSDGNPRLHSEDEPLAPSTRYGSQKAEAERCLRQVLDHYLIVRLSMNIGIQRRLGFPFSTWVDTLHRGESLRLITDQIHCVAWIDDSARAIETAIEKRLVGTFNLSAPEFLSRYEWGLQVCNAIGADPALVVPCTIDQFGFSEPRPLDLSLDTSKFQHAASFEFRRSEEVMQMLTRIHRE